MIQGKIGLMRKKLKPIVVIGFFLTLFAIIFISGVYGNRATAGKETTITQSNTNPTSIETIPSSSYYITNALEMKPIIDVSAQQRPSEIDYNTLSKNISGAIVRIQSGSHTKNENTALEDVWNEYPGLTNYEVRAALAGCGLTNEHITSKVFVLSGGEAAKVRLCKLMLRDINWLVLDEPTNHLDVDAKEELKRALISFKGSILLVSHEPEFYEDWVTSVWNIEDWTTKII